MKRTFLFSLLLLWLPAMALTAAGDFDPDTDYMALMIDAVAANDAAAGRAAQAARDEKLAATGLAYPSVNYVDLALLSRLIWAEAGSSWLDAEWKMSVGEVALNRVASPEFPNTLREVIAQPGQYYGPPEWYLDYLVPSRACAEAAARLLSGERVLNRPSVVFQSNGVLGSGIFKTLWDPLLGGTYLCDSYHMELYS